MRQHGCHRGICMRPSSGHRRLAAFFVTMMALIIRGAKPAGIVGDLRHHAAAEQSSCPWLGGMPAARRPSGMVANNSNGEMRRHRGIIILKPSSRWLAQARLQMMYRRLRF